MSEGRIWGDEEIVELRPFVVEPMQPVPAGKMPTGAARIVALALSSGMKVWSTYACAFVPNQLRKVGEQRQRITITLESVVVRFSAGAARGFAMFHNGSFEYAMTRDVGQWPARRGMEAAKTWIKEHASR